MPSHQTSSDDKNATDKRINALRRMISAIDHTETALINIADTLWCLDIAQEQIGTREGHARLFTQLDIEIASDNSTEVSLQYEGETIRPVRADLPFDEQNLSELFAPMGA